MEWIGVATIILLPFVVMAVEAYITIYTRSKRRTFTAAPLDTFRILVPIWGNIKYLENVDYLAEYQQQVTLCTTGDESEQFYNDLKVLQKEHRFKIYIDPPQLEMQNDSLVSTKRSTSGTIRDRVIANALKEVKEKFVIPLDADTTTSRDMSFLIGELESRGFDIASIKIVPRNKNNALACLQAYEYELAMRLRFVAPWLISGACHPAKTEVLRDIMSRHSLFFQGNDVETGLLAKALGYNVGHLPFEILTTVPDTFMSWFRQRLAWAGGEFRLFIINPKFIFRYPFFWFYGAFVTIFFFPLRWIAILGIGKPLFMLICLYAFLMSFIHWQNLNRYIFLLPFYTLFVGLVMVPLGIYWYFYMAIKDKNAGIINVNRNHEN